MQQPIKRSGDRQRQRDIIQVYYLLMDAIDSEIILAARHAVMLLKSKSGESSTMSMAIIPL
jgi:hypothetical protein